MDIKIILIITLFSVIQSVFGMGILIFGTPTLLLMGYSFGDVLSILLPPSLAISTIQFYRQDHTKKEFIRMLLTYCLPCLILALLWSFVQQQRVSLYLVIATILLISAASRLSRHASTLLHRVIEKNRRAYLVVMGFTHGSTNMGGSLLSTYAVSQHKQKHAVLNCVVTGYLLFGIVQLLTLSYVEALSVNYQTILNCTIATIAFLVLGNRIFTSFSDKIYQKIFSIFMLAYAAVLIISAD